LNMEIPLIKKAFNDHDKCIFLCTDNGFAPVSAVAIQSIIETSNENEKYDILLFHSGIMPFHKTAIESLANGHENISIRVVDISDLTKGDGFYVENRKTITQEAYYRLFVPFILEHSYKYAAYIDCDMVVLKDINEIFNYDINPYLIGAVRDYWGICGCYMPNSTMKEYRESIGLENIDDYVISATLLFNIEKYRQTFSYEQVLELVHSNKWQQHDQDVINVMCKGSILYLSAKWGMMTEWGNNNSYLPKMLSEEFSKVLDYSIYHYGGGRKPWKKYYEKENAYFWNVAPQTPYFEYLVSLIDSSEYKCYVLKNICNGRFDVSYSQDNVTFKTRGIMAGHLNLGYTQYRSIHIKDNTLHLEGVISAFPLGLTDELNVHVVLNGERLNIDNQFAENYRIEKLPEEIYRAQAFKTDIKLLRGNKYKLKINGETSGLTINPVSTLFGNFCVIGKELKNAYYYNAGWMVTFDPSGDICIFEAGKSALLKRELLLFKELLKSKATGSRKAAFARLIANTIKPFLVKPIWLVSDRISKADDNGEVFFSFLQAHKREVRSYFILDKASNDYSRLKNIGNVVQPYSFKHKLLTLIAECTISSQTDQVFRNPFRYYWHPYRDLLWSTDFVFLQHGVIMTKLTKWLKRSNQYIGGFITSTNKEYQLIKNGGYDYDSEVWLTGMPRYDRLESATERVITIAPTWRRYLTTHQNYNTGVWETVENFSNSKYVCFFNELLNNEQLTKACQKYGYVVQFKMHPSYLGKEALFGFSDDVKIVPENVSYQEIFSKSALMITDYSSSIHDFVYLHKPIIYCQFDKEEFFSGKHNCDDMTTDYETEGYGEVEYTVEGTVSRIIEYMQNDCALKEKYKTRIDNAFRYRDKNNCQRVYEKIMELND